MRHLVAVVAILILAASAFGVVAPGRLVAVLSAWPPDTRFRVAVGTRLVVGSVFVVAASSCRFPVLIRALGIVALAAAVLLLVLGTGRVDAMIRWWAEQPTLLIRAWCAVGALLGALILTAAKHPRTRRSPGT